MRQVFGIIRTGALLSGLAACSIPAPEPSWPRFHAAPSVQVRAGSFTGAPPAAAGDFTYCRSDPGTCP